MSKGPISSLISPESATVVSGEHHTHHDIISSSHQLEEPGLIALRGDMSETGVGATLHQSNTVREVPPEHIRLVALDLPEGDGSVLRVCVKLKGSCHY